MAVTTLAKAGLVLTAGMLALPAAAQALNPRWHGTWQSADETLVISDKAFRIGKENCRWSATVPVKFTTCTAYYNGSTSKASLASEQERAEKEVKTLLGDKSFNAGQKAQISKSMAQNRQALGQISNDTFKLVQFSDANRENGSGDCGGYFLLDKETVYKVFTCIPAPEAFSIKPYKKQP